MPKNPAVHGIRSKKDQRIIILMARNIIKPFEVTDMRDFYITRRYFFICIPLDFKNNNILSLKCLKTQLYSV